MTAIASRSRSEERLHRDPTTLAANFDYQLVLATLALFGFGVVMVYSATRGAEPPFDRSFLVRQLIYAAGGLSAMAIAAAVDYRRIADVAMAIYLATVGLLVAVLILGKEINATKGWFEFGFVQLQPAEMAKLGLVCGLASYVHRNAGNFGARQLVTAVGIAGVPFALIMAQPDLGSALVFIIISVAVVVVAGARVRDLAVICAISLLLVGAILASGSLDEYQRDRLDVFLSAGDVDVAGEAWNQEQAQIALGNGSMLGLGLFNGTQKNGAWVPEQQTDFIFTVVGEELGFVGGATMLGLFGFILWRIWRAAIVANDIFGRILCVGVGAMLLFQVFQSVGMTMGIMPITGIPLPFVSYGGSSLLTSFTAIGLVLGVSMRRYGR